VGITLGEVYPGWYIHPVYAFLGGYVGRYTLYMLLLVGMWGYVHPVYAPLVGM